MGSAHKLVTLALFYLLLVLPITTFAVEISQTQLVPPYKSITRFDVTLDITLDQVYNQITPATSTHYYIFRIHNDRTTALNLSGITKQYFMHLVTEGTPSNYVFYQFEGYRSVFEEFDNRTVYYTNWTQIPFESVYIPAGETKIFGLGFDLNNPFSKGDFNISFNFGGQEYLIDPDISACGALTTTNGVYTMTASIINQAATDNCIRINANNISLNCNGFTVDGNDTVDYGGIIDYSGTVSYNNTAVKNCIVSDWKIGVSLNGHNTTIDNVTSFSNIGQGIAPQQGETYVTGDYSNVTNCISYNNGGTGFVIASGKITAINLTSVNNTGQRGLQLYTSLTSPFNHTIINLTSNNNSVNVFVGSSLYPTTALFYNSTLSLDTTASVQLHNDSFAYFINSTFDRSKVGFLAATSIGGVFQQWYERFNFTLSTGTPQSSNFRLNNTLNGEIVNATAAATGLSEYILVTENYQNRTANTSYNPYTLNSHPSTAGYSLNSSILTFTTTGTWNILFYSSGSAVPVLSVVPDTLAISINNSQTNTSVLAFTVSDAVANYTIYAEYPENFTVWLNDTGGSNFLGTHSVTVQVNSSYFTDGLNEVLVHFNSTTPGANNITANLTFNVTFISVCTSGFAYSHIRVGSPIYAGKEAALGVFYADEYGIPAVASACNLKMTNADGDTLIDGAMIQLGTGLFVAYYTFDEDGDYFLVSNCECETVSGTDASVVHVVDLKDTVKAVVKYEGQYQEQYGIGNTATAPIISFGWLEVSLGAGVLIIIVILLYIAYKKR